MYVPHPILLNNPDPLYGNTLISACLDCRCCTDGELPPPVHPCCASSRNTRPKPPRMSTIQMHYDGWFTLPAAARQKFHLTTGDRLEVELVGDTIVLRPARGTAAPGHATAEQAPAAP